MVFAESCQAQLEHPGTATGKGVAGKAASKIAATIAATAAAIKIPTPCIAKTAPTKAPRHLTLEYSDLI